MWEDGAALHLRYAIADYPIKSRTSFFFGVNHSFIAAASTAPWLLTAMTAGPLMTESTLCDFGANVHIKGRDLVVFLYDGGPGLNLSFSLPMNDG